MIRRHGRSRSYGLVCSPMHRSSRRPTRRRYARRSINSWGEGAGCLAKIWERFRSASLHPQILVIPDGTSMRVLAPRIRIFLSWRVNVTSKGRALLMLFLFSDVGPADAPTRIRVGSHLEIVTVLARAGDEGLSLRELVASGVLETAGSRDSLATGDAGTVYLCHPFLVHAAQPHRGAHPRFMAQPPLLPAEPLALIRADGEYSPVEQAIRRALTVG